MGKIKGINIKNRTHYFYDDMVNTKDFDPNLLKLDKKLFKNIAIYDIGYITKKNKYKIDSANPLYLLVHEIDGFIEEIEGSKYLNISLADSNSKVLQKKAEIWSGIKDQVERINGSKSGEYEKDYMKIKLNSDDDLPLNKQLKSMNLTIIVRIVFEEDGKNYPQTFLDECLYELQKCHSMKELMFLKELILISQKNQKRV